MENAYLDAKLKLIHKYAKKSRRLNQDTNQDTFVTLDDFLSNETSLGPEADYGNIYYTHDNYENINNYMKILVNNLGFNKVVCIPDFFVKTGDKYIIKNTIAYNITRDELVIPIDLLKNVKKCNKRFMYINLMIRWEQRLVTHINMIIIDFVEKTIERYEPHGRKMRVKKNKDILKDLDSKFSAKILSYVGLNKYKYISPVDFSPLIGIQLKVDAYDGMCLTYSLMYLQLRIMNPDVDQKDIVKYLLKKPKAEMYDILLKYAKYVEEQLKDNSNEIIVNTEKLYNTIFYKHMKFIVVNKRNEIDEIEY